MGCIWKSEDLKVLGLAMGLETEMRQVLETVAIVSLLVYLAPPLLLPSSTLFSLFISPASPCKHTPNHPELHPSCRGPKCLIWLHVFI